jgi:hypothetical protein
MKTFLIACAAALALIVAACSPLHQALNAQTKACSQGDQAACDRILELSRQVDIEDQNAAAALAVGLATPAAILNAMHPPRPQPVYVYCPYGC